MITKEEVIKINRQRAKANKANMSKDLEGYLSTIGDQVRMGKFINRNNVFVRPIRGDKEFQAAVLKYLEREGFNASVKSTTREPATTVRARGGNYQKVCEIFHLHLDLNVE